LAHWIWTSSAPGTNSIHSLSEAFDIVAMGLLKFWNTFTSPRVREITPQENCKWLEQPRPTTSNGRRFKKNNVSSPNLSELASSHGSPITGDDKSSIFSKSGFRPWKRRKSLYGLVPDRTEDIPQVPDLIPDVQPWRAEERRIPEDDIFRPGTAITTEEPPAWNEVFELAADEVVIMKPEDGVDDAAPPNIRKRSKSSASERPRSKRASWFSIGRRRLDDELPPLPIVALDEPLSPVSAMELPPFSDAPVIPAAQGFRDSLGAESILRAFPSVPSPAADDASPFEPTMRNSVFIEAPKKRFQGTIEIHKPLASPKSFSQPKSPMLAPEGWSRPTSKLSDRRVSHQRGVSMPANPRHLSDDGFLSVEQQREYTRVTKFLEHMDRKSASGGVVSVVTELDATPINHRSKYSNDEALAALQFGIVEE